MKWSLIEACRDLLFPPLCLHCSLPKEFPANQLCAACSLQMEVLSPENRCNYCFDSLEDCGADLCKECAPRYPPYQKMAAVFDYTGPPASLIRHLKYSNMPWLAEGLAAYSYYQLSALGWTNFDIIIPMPITWTHYLKRGYNQARLIACALGGYSGSGVLEAIGRHAGEVGQAGKSLSQRRELQGASFFLRNEEQIRGKSILLVDDVYTTGTSIEKCCETILTAYPKKIYVLTVCRA